MSDERRRSQIIDAVQANAEEQEQILQERIRAWEWDPANPDNWEFRPYHTGVNPLRTAWNTAQVIEHLGEKP